MDASPPPEQGHDRARSVRRLDAAMGGVAFLGLYQGAVPLVVRPVFGADQRFAPALWLPAPWWWLACAAVTLGTLALLAALYRARERHSPHRPPGEERKPAEEKREGERSTTPAAGYDVLMAVVLLLTLHNGVVPIVARLVFDAHPWLALPLRLDAPWWWITALTALAGGVLLLAVLDQAKQRRHPPDDGPADRP